MAYSFAALVVVLGLVYVVKVRRDRRRIVQLAASLTEQPRWTVSNEVVGLVAGQIQTETQDFNYKLDFDHTEYLSLNIKLPLRVPMHLSSRVTKLDDPNDFSIGLTEFDTKVSLSTSEGHQTIAFLNSQVRAAFLFLIQEDRRTFLEYNQLQVFIKAARIDDQKMAECQEAIVSLLEGLLVGGSTTKQKLIHHVTHDPDGEYRLICYRLLSTEEQKKLLESVRQDPHPGMRLATFGHATPEENLPLAKKILLESRDLPRQLEALAYVESHFTKSPRKPYIKFLLDVLAAEEHMIWSRALSLLASQKVLLSYERLEELLARPHGEEESTILRMLEEYKDKEEQEKVEALLLWYLPQLDVVNQKVDFIETLSQIGGSQSVELLGELAGSLLEADIIRAKARAARDAIKHTLRGEEGGLSLTTQSDEQGQLSHVPSTEGALSQATEDS